MKPPPSGWPRISASIYYEDPLRAIPFLCAAFGFEVQIKVEEHGVLMHSELVIPGGLVMVGGLASEKRPDAKWRKSPRQVGGATQSLFTYVDDIEAHFARARAAGATIASEPTTVDYGEGYWIDRGYEAIDLEGHHWQFAQRMR